jgi:hypothetical protein
MLGANIQPSATQTAMGKDMWAKWKKGGDTKHLTSMNAKMDQQGVAEMDKSQKSPAGWNLDDYDYSKGKWTRGKIVTAKDAVKDMGKELNRAFNNPDSKDKKKGVAEGGGAQQAAIAIAKKASGKHTKDGSRKK